MPIEVELVSPERILWSGEAEMVIARTEAGGDIAFLAGHAPFVGVLGIGPVRIKPVGAPGEEVAAVHGGFVEVKDNKVTILSDVAELPTHIDVARAREAEARAAEASRTGEPDPDTQAALRRARLRLEVAGQAPTTVH